MISLVLAAALQAAPPTVDACDFLAAAVDVDPTIRMIFEYPVGPSESDLGSDLSHRFESAVTGLGLSDLEVQALATAARRHEFAGYLEPCRWMMTVVPRAEPSTKVAQFTRPLLTPDGRLAIVAVLLNEYDRGAGSVCAVRRQADGWRATCKGTYIWAR